MALLSGALIGKIINVAKQHRIEESERMQSLTDTHKAEAPRYAIAMLFGPGYEPLPGNTRPYLEEYDSVEARRFEGLLNSGQPYRPLPGNLPPRLCPHFTEAAPV